MLFAHLVEGGVASLDDFMDTYWQKKTLHIAHGDANWLSDVFGLYDVEELWASAANAASCTSPQSAVGGLLIFPETGVKGTKALNPFFAFASRCSVVVNRGDRFCARLRDLCHKLETQAPHFPMACCNVYLTPPDAQSVRRHSDDRDVLLLQVFGEKEWTVYNAPIPLPYRDEEVGKSSPVDEACLTERTVYHIAQGDVLYMPRGVVHEAKTTKASSSLHITVALQTSDWDYASVITTAIQQVLRSPELQRSRVCCPLGALSAHDRDRHKMEEAARNMQSILADLHAHPHLSDFSFAQEVFQRRIRSMQLEREVVLDETSVAVPAPIVASSLIMWNPTIEIEGIEALAVVDPNVPKMQYIVHCSRRTEAPDDGSCETSTAALRDNMKFGVTDEMLRCIRWLSKNAHAHPVQVRQIPMFDDLGKIALCVVLINNMSCIRVS